MGYDLQTVIVYKIDSTGIQNQISYDVAEGIVEEYFVELGY